MSVIISRALPDARDGFKPSQRRILYAMHDLSLFPGRQHRKCAKICGDTSGNYHPHGEAVIYPTLVHMAQPWAMRETAGRRPGEFRFGRRRSAGGDALHRSAHDASRRRAHDRHGQGHGRFRPELRRDARPSRPFSRRHFPNLLVNGGTGIAVGMATNMPPHNLGEVIDGICAQIDNPDITLDGVDEVREGPGFSDRLHDLRRRRRSSNISRPAAAA